MDTLNQFNKGDIHDLDPALVPNEFVIDAMNIRIITTEGQGMIVTNIAGNEFSFSLSPGFVPLGATEYNGIAFIACFNPLNNQCEFGTYPSPKIDCSGGFDHVYRPLNNFTGNVNPIITPTVKRSDFTTTLFNWDCEHPLRIEPRIDYDNSVNLYFVDFKNPYRSINTGFNISGVCNNRLYWNGSFPNLVDALNETCSWIKISSSSVAIGGKLKCGNTHLFFRYKTIDFNSTSFNGFAGAFQIAKDNTKSNLLTDGGKSDDVSDSKILLSLANIDQSYVYIEMAFIRYVNGGYETGLIDNLYPISGPTMDIEYTGSEGVVAFTLEDIVRRKTNNDIPKSIAQLESRIWLGNLKSREIHHPDLEAAALQIRPKYDDTARLQDTTWASGFNTKPLNSILMGQNKDPNVIKKHSRILPWRNISIYYYLGINIRKNIKAISY